MRTVNSLPPQAFFSGFSQPQRPVGEFCLPPFSTEVFGKTSSSCPPSLNLISSYFPAWLVVWRSCYSPKQVLPTPQPQPPPRPPPPPIEGASCMPSSARSAESTQLLDDESEGCSHHFQHHGEILLGLPAGSQIEAGRSSLSSASL